MGLAARKLLMTPPAAGGGGAFDPWSGSYPTPVHAFWAEDASWTNPGDGNQVSSWRNESGAGDAVQATSGDQPIYRSSTAAYNDKPTIEFVSNDRLVLSTAIGADFQVVAVANMTSNNQRIIGFDSGSGSDGIGRGSGTTWVYVSPNTNVISGGTGDANPHIFVAYSDGGGTSEFFLDNTSLGTVATGSATSDIITLGCPGDQTTRFQTGHIAYVGYYALADDVSGLVSALADHYGITIA